MSGSKVALKAINAAIQAKKYDDAIDQSKKLLATDPESYQGNLFLGFALDKQATYLDAETAYYAACRIKDSDPKAWKGLIQVYEKQGSSKVGEYQDAALRLAKIYQNLDDKYKCQDVVDKFLAFAKNQGTRLQHRKALDIILPTSAIYGYLEGRIPHPSYTYQLIAQITEFEEKEQLNKEIGERRTRLGSKIGQVTLEVQREVFRHSDLEDVYAKIISWCNDDEIRRQYEEKLLQRCLEALVVLPEGNQKTEKRAKVFGLASDMVIIKHPYKLAWEITIEWKDPEVLQDYDANILLEYITFFPTSGLSQVLRGFMSSEISPFPTPRSPPRLQRHKDTSDESDDADDEGGVILEEHISAGDRLLLMTEGMADSNASALAHRLMGEYYQFLEEHESVVDLMRNGLRLVDNESSKLGLEFRRTTRCFTALLATALVFYQSPKNHPEAKTLFDAMLIQDPNSSPALIGIGLVYEEEEDYPSAVDFLGRALGRNPSNIRVRTEYAWVKAVNSEYKQGFDELKACLPDIGSKDPRSRDLLSLTQYRIGVCLWNIDSSRTARKDRSGAYSYFIAALKSNLNFAPAYTQLGIFYADYAKDRKRARKCFHKAFELSPSEADSAERLARDFAEQGDWESVEVVAQRVVDSGKVRPAPGSKKKGSSWPFAALGVSQLNRQDYANSVVSFQAALRISPDDYHSWVGLGESYHNLGRFIAATKAFKHAEQFEKEVQSQESGEIWFAAHMLANVRRELGDYDNAIEEYRSVLTHRPSEFGVSIALIQTLVDGAWDSIDRGLFGEAANRSVETIDKALQAVESQTVSFNLWKAVGDACAIFSWIESRVDEFPCKNVERLLQTRNDETAYNLFADIDGVALGIQDASSLTRCLHAAILCQKRAIHASAHDAHAQAVAYYNLGWTEHRAHVSLSRGLKRKSTRYLKAAVRCFKRAIELEARNSDFWNSLGVVTSELNPKVAQHSFIRSLYLNERSARAWTNLGTLYLLQNDHQLANEAFIRAQSTDPDFAHAWVGQALLALVLGDAKEANLLFEHAMHMSQVSSPITKRQYTQSTFDQIIASSAISSITDLVQPFFALRQLQSVVPEDLNSQHLLALFSERLNDIDTAVAAFAAICEKVEADYEVTESPSSLSHFALATANLARCKLAAYKYDEASDNGETALQLSAEDAGNQLSAEARHTCRLSAHLTVGLAHYYQGNTKAALEYFQPALEESDHHPDAVCLLTQVLWAKGDSDSRGEARDHLFNCIEKHPGHVQAVLLLGIIALLDNDSESLEAVNSELQSLRTSQNITDEEQDRVGELLYAIATITGDTEQDIMSEIPSSLYLYPNQSQNWARMATITEDDVAAEMALTTAVKAVLSGRELEALDLAKAYAGTGKATDAQKAVMIAPWKQDGWDALGGRRRKSNRYDA